jgi:hypothetical protein
MNKFDQIDGLIGDPMPALEFKEWSDVCQKVVRGVAAKPSILKQMLRTISNSLRKLPDFKEPANILEATSFAKVWAGLSFVAAVPSVAGERTIR